MSRSPPAFQTTIAAMPVPAIPVPASHTNPRQRVAITLSLFCQIGVAWAFFMVAATVARGVFLVLTSDYWPKPVAISEVAMAFFQGARLDSSAIGHLFIPTMLATVAAIWIDKAIGVANWIRRGTAAVLLVAIPVLTLATAYNYQELQDTFGIDSFEFLHGNAIDVLLLAHRKHNLALGILLTGILSFVGYRAYRTLDERAKISAANVPLREWVSVCTVIGGIAVYVCLARGSIGNVPACRDDASVSKHSILNVCAMNPIVALKYAFRDYQALTTNCDHNPFVKPTEIETVAVQLAQEIATEYQRETPPDNSANRSVCRVDHPLWQRTARGNKSGRPSHVFVLFLESYDSWPFLDEFGDLHLVDEGKRLAKNGIHIRNFLPGTGQSISSYQVAMQGLFETKRVSQQEMPTSIVANLERLGYRSRSVAGYSSATGNEARYVKQQGFDEWYFTADIPSTTAAPLNRVHDRDVYDFVANGLRYDEPTFTFVRTISNHTPWSIDLQEHDCQVTDLPAALHRRAHNDLNELQLSMGHLRYSDREMGRFVRQMTERFPNSLFVITGDHYGRNHFDRDAKLYGRSSVPLILYGPQVLQRIGQAPNACGSHVDLAATLIERCAPSGFRYAAIGRDLLRPGTNQFGVGTGVVIFDDCIVNLKNRAYVEQLPWHPAKAFTDVESANRIAKAKRLHAAYHGVGFAMTTDALSRDFRMPHSFRGDSKPAHPNGFDDTKVTTVSYESPTLSQEPLHRHQSECGEKESPGTYR